MSAEQLIALETTLGELGNRYVVAKRFVPLRAEADDDLMPRLTRLGSTLRNSLRRGQFDDAALKAAGGEIAGLRAQWEARLEGLHDSPAYQALVKAWEDGDATHLRRSLPEMLADAEVIVPPPVLFVAVSASSGRRRPGSRPFLTAEACADRIATYRERGIPSEVSGDQWWDRELTTLAAADDPDALDTPIALRIDSAALALPVFHIAHGALYHLFCPTLRVSFSVALQADVDDEWWKTYEEYDVYRDQLANQLRQRGFTVDIAKGT